ncbi:TonB family C-terminal domain-containing protein [Lishizhenia tianjinensis]|uniref:TonB family C-terminal domain-containing protein n=1 Tax=Lishizhenia tianjinensis TaxID=477690 RepID=A0A1I6YL48_9FLAO|nr:energy transducer TonB [Lishizhenia tianjinensis]SFT51058.1 TonB family C-terminal domain-containing protein [Lishizhenia tianjinensis]
MKNLVVLPLVCVIISFSAFSAGDPSAETCVNTTEVIKNWVEEILEYPTLAIERRQEGTVQISFTIKDGKINAWVSEGVCKLLDNAALEAVNNTPLNQLILCSDQEGEQFTLPVKFRLI